MLTINMLNGSLYSYTVEKNSEALLVASKENSIELNAEKTKYMAMSRVQNAGQNCNINLCTHFVVCLTTGL